MKRYPAKCKYKNTQNSTNQPTGLKLSGSESLKNAELCVTDNVCAPISQKKSMGRKIILHRDAIMDRELAAARDKEANQIWKGGSQFASDINCHYLQQRKGNDWGYEAMLI